MKIAVAEPLGLKTEIIEAELKNKIQTPFSLEIFETAPGDDAEFTERCREADIVIEVNRPMGEEIIGKCPNLKLIAVAFAGVDHIDFEACEKYGVAVKNCPGYSASAVAELVFAYLGNLYRNLPEFDRTTRAGGTRNGFLGTEIGSKTVGIIGYGAIGKKVAQIARGYGCRVLAFSRHSVTEPGVEAVDLETLLRNADAVTVHIPLTPENRHFLNAERIALMKPGAVLINTARGPVIDSDALAEALEEGRLRGAGIDVFETEPPVDTEHPLLQSAKTAVTPHIGFATEEAFMTRLRMTADNIAAFLKEK